MLMVDTGPLVDFLKGESGGGEKAVAAALRESKPLAISVVTLSELFYILAGARGEGFAAACLRTVRSQVEVFAIDAEIAEKAGEFKFRYAGGGKKGLPMADALIAATAWKHGCELLTADPHFAKVVEIRTRGV